MTDGIKSIVFVSSFLIVAIKQFKNPRQDFFNEVLALRELPQP